jgi:hypothetical protein
MADELPGFIPRVLQLDDVSLLRADEAVLKAMRDEHHHGAMQPHRPVRRVRQ